jgi:hypothetical protein
VNSRFVRRLPSRYTASYSTRRVSRLARGNNNRGGLHACKAVTSFSSAFRKNFSSALAFHTGPEPVFLMAGSDVGLISTLWQRRISSSLNRACMQPEFGTLLVSTASIPVAHSLQSALSRIAQRRQTDSLIDPCTAVKKAARVPEGLRTLAFPKRSGHAPLFPRDVADRLHAQPKQYTGLLSPSYSAMSIVYRANSTQTTARLSSGGK